MFMTLSTLTSNVETCCCLQWGPSHLVYGLQNAFRAEVGIHKLPVNGFHRHILLTHSGFVNLQHDVLLQEEGMLLSFVALYRESHQPQV